MQICFGENLRKLRVEQGFTQEKLAQRLHVSFQTISKWERGDTYPDLAMLPAIALLFGVSTDNLLGVNAAETEAQIQQILEQYNVVCNQSKKFKEFLPVLRDAVQRYPNDYRLLVAYMNCLMVCGNTSVEGAHEIRDEIEEIYDNIQANCTNDDIRLEGKRLICILYKSLSRAEPEKLNQMEKLLMSMPRLGNSRDFVATFLYPPGEKHDEACKNAIVELIYLLNAAVINQKYYDDQYAVPDKLAAAETMLAVLDMIFPNGDYGRNTRHAIYVRLLAAQWYAKLGESEAVKKNVKTMFAIAERFDALPQVSVHTSPLLKGLVFEKKTFAPGFSGNGKEEETGMAARLREMLEEGTDYPTLPHCGRMSRRNGC